MYLVCVRSTFPETCLFLSQLEVHSFSYLQNQPRVGYMKIFLGRDMCRSWIPLLSDSC